MNETIKNKILAEITNIRESETMEIKKSRNLPDDFWPTYSSFSNTHGGIVILGVDEGDPPVIKNTVVGVNNPNKIKDDLLNTLSNKNKVSFNSLSEDNIMVLNYKSKEVIIIFIPETPLNRKPVYLNDKIDQSYIRVGTADVKMTKSQISEFSRLSSPIGDSQIVSNYDLDDLDEMSILAYKEIVSLRYKNKNFMELDNTSFLKEIGAIFKDRTTAKYNITVGSLLFFGKNNSIKERFPKFFLDYINRPNLDKRWVSRVNSDMILDQEVNLFNFFRIVEERLKNSIPNEFNLDSEQTRESESTLDNALREALVNSLVHADYYSNDPIIKIEANDGLYTFENSGPLNIPKTQFFSGGTSIARNEILMKLFSLMGKSERQGFGGHIIYEFAAINNKKLPDIVTNFNKTTLKIWNVDYMNELPENERIIYSTLYKKLPLASRSQIIKVTSLSVNDFKVSINSLMKKGLVERIGNSRATKYKIKMSSQDDLNRLAILVKEMQHKL